MVDTDRPSGCAPSLVHFLSAWLDPPAVSSPLSLSCMAAAFVRRGPGDYLLCDCFTARRLCRAIAAGAYGSASSINDAGSATDPGRSALPADSLRSAARVYS